MSTALNSRVEHQATAPFNIGILEGIVRDVIVFDNRNDEGRRDFLITGFVMGDLDDYKRMSSLKENYLNGIGTKGFIRGRNSYFNGDVF